MKDQLKALGLLAGALLIGWLAYTAFVLVYDVRNIVTGECRRIEQSVIDDAVAKAKAKWEEEHGEKK